MKKFRFLPLLLTIHLLALLLSGCVSGPYWKQNFVVPSITRTNQAYNEVIVSGFLSAEKMTTVTGSLEIETIMESAAVFDMSNEIALALRNRGIRAEARDKFTRADLKPGQLLLRGAAIASKTYTDRLGTWLIPYFLTLGLFGLWAPSPLTYDEGYVIQYRVDVIDHNGRYVLSTGSKEARLYVKMRHVLTEKPDTKMFNIMRESIAKELAAKMQL